MEGMRSRKLVYYAVLLMVLFLGGENAGGIVIRCREREREALLAFKRGLVDYIDKLSSWGSRDADKQDCCTWEGVYCSNQTGHVIKLDLPRADYIYYFVGKMFSPKLVDLQHLRYLDLRGIDFNRSQVPESIGSLTNLRYLGLHNASFGSRILIQVGNLTNLHYLDLSKNEFTNVRTLNWVSRLSWLTYLDLSITNLSNVFDFLEALNNLPKLRKLKLVGCYLPSPQVGSTLVSINSSKSLASVILSRNYLTSSVFGWLSNYNTSLVRLDLLDNRLAGPIPEVFRNVSSLVHLDLSYNQLEGEIPPSFARLSSLQTLILKENNLSGQVSKFVNMLLSTSVRNSLENLDLSQNHFTGLLPNLTSSSSLKELKLNNNQLSGRVPESIGEMSKLEIIDFGMNSLEGVISATHFSNLSNLKELDLSSNSLVLNLSSDWIPPFQLESIILRSCKIGLFPKWLQTQKSFSSLDISNAEISDKFPSWFWDSCQSRIDMINISHNQIRGSLAYFSTFEFVNHPQLDLSSNRLEGPLPSFLSKATYLDLSNNNISGSISSLCTSEAMSPTFLDISSNNLAGELPDCLTHWERLVMLDLSNNALSGEVPATIGSLYNLQTLKLRRNRFVGELPPSLKNCTSLVVLDLGYNRLSGPLPKWLGVTFQNLVILVLSSNHFNGSMPSELCKLTRVQILDVSENNISGSIPKCISNWTTLAQKGNSSLNISHSYWTITGETFMVSYEDEATFVWKGQIYSYKNTLGLVRTIDLSSNRLTGEIPTAITHLVELVSLNLSRNQLTGGIPANIGNLQSLDSLDLSRNQIDGSIPTSLARIDRLPFLDLSYNNLSGKIPVGTQLQGFNSSVYAGNAQLCGLPLLKKCDPDEKGPNERTVIGNHEDKDDLISRGFYISIAVGFVVGFWGVCASLIFNRTWRYTCLNFLNGLNDWLYVRIALIKRQLKDP